MALLDEMPDQDGSRPFDGPDELARFALWANEWIDTFFEAVSATSISSPQGAVDLHREVRSLADERARFHSVTRRRPWLQLIDTARDGVDLLSELARACLAALAAGTPTEAEQNASDAQRHIDSFTERLAPCAALLQRMEQLFQQKTPAEHLKQLLAQETASRAVHDLPELLQHTDAEIGALVGVMPAPSYGVGLQFVLYESALSVYGNPHRFRQVVKNSYAVFAQDPTRLMSLTADPHFLPDLSEALLDWFDTGAQVTRAMYGEGTLARQTGRTLVSVATSLVEGAGQLVACALLTCSGRKSRPYTKLRQDNATTLLRAVADTADLGPLVQGYNWNLRTAEAHRMLRYTEHGVHGEISSGEIRLSWEELVDEIIQANESTLGCLVALVHALSTLGIKAIADDAWTAFGITHPELLHAALTTMGCSDAVFEEGPGTWTVSVTPPTSVAPSTLAVAVGTLVPDQITTLRLRLRMPDGLHVLSGPVAPLRAFAGGHDPDGDSHAIATARFLRTWTYDSTHCLDTAALRCWIAFQAGTALTNDPAGAIARLRALRGLARELDDPEAVEALTAAIRSVRAEDRMDRQSQDSFNRLTDWLRTPGTVIAECVN
ncbi:hypothetical protein ACF1AE_33925 [Streptomyces sp. NPDC014986]|uniref:hypothetical protein n=1 Tax=Streptomyces sp. NPDC014986 TaxID=3364934 RepID=UPI0036FF85D8